MAMTEARDAATAETEPAGEPAAATAPRRGLAGVLGDGDHKTTGRLFIAFALLFLLVSSVAGGLLGVEKVDPGQVDILTGDSLAAAFTLHDVSGVFLFLLPLALGLAIYLVPLQVGASTIAFPRAAGLAFWTWLLAGALLITSYGIGGGPSGTDTNGVLLWIGAMGLTVVGLCVATLCVLATILTLRTAGMRLERLPLFSWSMLTAGTTWLLSLPVMVAMLVLLWLDVRYEAGLFSAGVYAQVSWVFLPPQILAFAVPALGIAGESVPVFAGVRLARRDALLGAIGATALLGFGAWTFIGPQYPDLVEEALFVGMGVLAVVAVLAFTGGLLDAMRRGRVSLASPVLAGVLGLLLVLAGAAAGAVGVLPFTDLVGTTWFAGQTHLVLGGASVVLLGGLYYWAPKLWGRVLPDGSGKLAALAAAGGVALLAAPDLITGALGQDSRLPSTQEVGSGWGALNALSVVGGALLLLAVLLVLVSLAGAVGRAHREPAPDDPWDGHTLEWATSSPPPPGNFPAPPTVESATPVLDRREATEAVGTEAEETGAEA
jgi:heme/copper-type cytochrome/quinol oxidase subunit 1